MGKAAGMAGADSVFVIVPKVRACEGWAQIKTYPTSGVDRGVQGERAYGGAGQG
jgi:hypothetical protein